MGSFRRAFLGYRRPEVDAAISARDVRIDILERDLGESAELQDELQGELATLSEMVIEREREIRGLGDQLREANDRYDRSIASLDTVTARLQEIEAQARGQATRIRMKALREAVEVGRRAQEVSDAEGGVAPANPAANGHANGNGGNVYSGPVRLEIGPLGDYAQLVGLEDAIGELGGTEISVERFSEGRATLSMNLEQPIDLLRELEGLSSLEFNVRRTGDDSLILDVDEDEGPGRRAA